MSPICDCLTLAWMRETYHLGCTPHWIQVLKVTQEAPWVCGVLLGMDGFIADILLDDAEATNHLGTLWPAKLASAAMGGVRRDDRGRPRIRWNKHAGVLQLIGPSGSYPTFSVLDADEKPGEVEAWLRLPMTCEHRDNGCREVAWTDRHAPRSVRRVGPGRGPQVRGSTGPRVHAWPRRGREPASDSSSQVMTNGSGRATPGTPT